MILRLFSARDVPDTALTVNVEVSARSGVPEITPEVLMLKPDGRFPESRLHDAPEGFEVKVAEYELPTVPEGRLVVVMLIVDVTGSGLLPFSRTTRVNSLVAGAPVTGLALTVNV